MKTTLQNLNDLELENQVISGKKAKDIYMDMQFKAVDEKIYSVWDVYLSFEIEIRIAVSAEQWWSFDEVKEWVEGTVGQGMEVIAASGERGVIKTIFPNRVCHVVLETGKSKTFNEKELTLYSHVKNYS